MLSNRPKISVIMSVYNGEKYLREAMESILNQIKHLASFNRIIKGMQKNIRKIGFNVFIVLLFLILARIISVILFYNGIPPNLFHEWGLTYLIHQDQFEYFRVALNFSKLQFTETHYPIGFPLLLVPFIYTFHANTLADIFMPVSVFNSIFLYCGSILLIYGIANRITGDNKISLLASTLWILLPYKLPHGMWVYVLSEPPMIFVMLLAIYIYLRGRESESASLKNPFFVGMLTAFGVMFRIPTALFVLFFALMYVFERKFKHCIIFLASALVFLIPQFIYNNIGYHSVAKTGYTVSHSATHLFSINYVVPFFDQILHNNWIYSLFGLLVFSTIGILYLFITCKNKFKVFFLASWLYSFFAVFSVMTFGPADPGRYCMPSYPAVVICIACGLVIGVNLVKVIISGLFKGERKDIKKFIIVVIPVLYLLFACTISPSILSEYHTYNLNNAKNDALEYSGWYANSTGLWLKPGTSGVLLCEIKIKGYPYVFIHTPFYNPCTNRLEISTDGGKHYDVLGENKNMTGVINIMEYTKDNSSFLLKFTASNNFEDERLVAIRNIIVIHESKYKRG